MTEGLPTPQLADPQADLELESVDATTAEPAVATEPGVDTGEKPSPSRSADEPTLLA